ncbi:MAG TPA: chemotaxis protein, partial [Rheinheimera sp.]|nr:chemotaxis protein [Rheinheimera sp.]
QLFSTPIAGTDLRLLMLLNRDALTAPVIHTVTLQLSAIVVLLTLVIIALNMLIGRLLAPLHRVSQALADIAHGESDLSKRLPV